MYMKARNLLLSASALLCSAVTMAQEPVHGVDGYYNFTPTQMKASGQFTIGNNGKKVGDCMPTVRYTDDMQYMIFNMGVNNTTINDEQGGYQFRSEVNLAEVSKGDGAMVMTSAYPVLAFKLSSVVGLADTQSKWGYNEINVEWYNPDSEDGTNPGQTSGDKYRLLLSGLDNNGRFRFYHFQSVLKDAFNRDSVYLNNNQGLGNDKYRMLNNVTDEKGEKIRSYNAVTGDSVNAEPAWRILRVDPIDGEKADVIIGLNLKAVRKSSGLSYLDSCDIKIKNISFMPFDAFADYEGKSQDELPRIYFKWIKTFPSWQDFEASLCDEKGWGDGEKIDPNKAVLNSEVYALSQLIHNYQFSDQINILKDAYDAAVLVLNAGTSTSTDYLNQVDAIARAKEQFMAAIVYVPETPMIKFYSWTGLALGLTSQEVTVGDYTGRALTPVEAENAVPFMLQASGAINGQTCYNVMNGSNTMVRASDGQLIFVPADQLNSASAKANLVLSNRRTQDEPAYDFKIDRFFYYIDVMETGDLTFADALPMADEIDELSAYMFTPMPAGDYDPSDHNNTTHPMTTGEGSLFEFNGEVETVLNPAYEASFAQYEWDPTAKAVATERAKQQQFEGWRTNGWRVGCTVEAVTLQGQEKTMAISLRNVFDQIHNDSVNVAMDTINWSEAQILSVMREHGKYTSALNRIPQPNQLCDSLWAINLNSGINRYLAIKWKGNKEALTFNGLVFFVRKGIEEPTVNMSNLKEQRGDVYIWDLLECGIPYGDRKACAQYLSWGGVASAADIVYVDWMRFYASLDDIPSETMTVPAPIEDGIKAVSSEHETGAITFYDLNGRMISTTRPSVKGVYLLKQGKTTMKVIVR